MVTSAPGTTAPEESVTTPRMRDVMVCAKSPDQVKASKNRTRTIYLTPLETPSLILRGIIAHLRNATMGRAVTVRGRTRRGLAASYSSSHRQSDQRVW